MLGAGIALAAATMVPRLALEIAAVNPSILRALWPTLAVLALVPLAAAAYAARRAPPAVGAQVKLSNPLQLRTAVGFGLLLSALFVAAAAVRALLGDAGVYAMAAAAGLFDVDAIGLMLASEAGRTMPAATAERAIALAVLVNTAAKAVLATALGGVAMLRSATSILAIALVAAAATASITLS
jgi:uncharacterized membrane protein (DUF4010 family)